MTVKPISNMLSCDVFQCSLAVRTIKHGGFLPTNFTSLAMGIIAFLSVVLIGSILAQPIGVATANSVAMAKLAELDQSGRFHLVETPLSLLDEDNRAMAYVYHLYPQGFIAVSGNRVFPPIIAYSLDNPFGITDGEKNPLLVLIKSDLSKRLACLSSESCLRGVDNREAWDRHLSGDVPSHSDREFRQWPPAGTTSTGGWLETRWTQDPPYNAFCPVDPTTGNRSLAGCPSVAMAQILNYHSSLNGTRLDDDDDYYHNYAGQYWIDDDFEDYGFPSFPELNVYLDTLSNHYQNEESVTNNDKAAVVFACGVAARQVYSSQGSGTYGVDQALQAYLRFGHNEIELLGQAAPDLYRRLSLNMIEALPAHLAVVTPQWNAGHNLVVDGYNTDGYYHMNFGWGGYANGWYDLPEELPYDLTVIEGLILDIASTSIHPDGNDEPSSAEPIGLSIYNESHTINPEDDVDWFVFYSEDGADLLLFLEKVVGAEIDPAFFLYGPHEEDGSDVEPDSCILYDDNSHGDLQPEISFTSVTAGYYFLRVMLSDSTGRGESTGAYLLTIEVVGGLASPESLSAQVVGNDIHLEWEAPEGTASAPDRDLIGYHAYRDQVRLNSEIILTAEYDDPDLPDGTYTYFVTAIYQGGESQASNVVYVQVPSVSTEPNPVLPLTTNLRCVYPNPFLGATGISYSLAKDMIVSVIVYDLAGKRIRTLVQGMVGRGEHSIVWDGTDEDRRTVSAGLYLCRMTTSHFTAQRSLVMLR